MFTRDKLTTTEIVIDVSKLFKIIIIILKGKEVDYPISPEFNPKAQVSEEIVN